MNPLLIGLLGVMLLPLFLATWRTHLLSLSCQGLLLAWIAHRFEPYPSHMGWWVTLTDLGVIRGLIIPVAAYQAMRARQLPPRAGVLPPNLLSWALAFAFVLLAFTGAEKLIPAAGEDQTVVAVATAGLLLGFLVLSTQASPFSQMMGALRIENAIALAELGDRGHHLEPGIQLGLLAVFVTTVLLFLWYLASGTSEEDAAISTGAGPTL